MGLENRSYYRDDPGYGYVDRFSQGRSIVIVLIMINVAVFVLDMFSPVKFADQAGGTSFHWLGYLLALKSDSPWFVWTWLTYGFTHAPYDEQTIGLWHILGNMLGLFFLGRAVEQRMGSTEFLSFYLVAIVVSGLGALILNTLTGVNPSTLVGASGAVSAVVVLFILWFPNVTLLIWGILPVPAWAVGVLMVASNLLYAFDPSSQVSWQAHLIGALFGLAYLKARKPIGSLGLDQLPNLFNSRPKLRLHDPNASREKMQAEADRILDKINQSGEASLTSKERKLLNKYSHSLRKNRQQD